MIRVGGVVVLVLSSPGLGCESSNHAPTERGETSTQSREQSEGRRASVWQRAVPSAYLRGPSARETRRRGTRLSAHWLSRKGTVTDADPTGKVVAWPAPLRISATPTTAFRIAMPEKPDRVDIRAFGSAVDAAGVPLEQPQLIACSQRTLERDCRFT